MSEMKDEQIREDRRKKRERIRERVRAAYNRNDTEKRPEIDMNDPAVKALWERLRQEAEAEAKWKAEHWGERLPDDFYYNLKQSCLGYGSESNLQCHGAQKEGGKGL